LEIELKFEQEKIEVCQQVEKLEFELLVHAMPNLNFRRLI